MVLVDVGVGREAGWRVLRTCLGLDVDLVLAVVEAVQLRPVGDVNRHVDLGAYIAVHAGVFHAGVVCAVVRMPHRQLAAFLARVGVMLFASAFCHVEESLQS